MVYQRETGYQKGTLFFRVKTVRGSNTTFTSFTPTHFVRCCPFCLTNRLTALRPERRKGMSLRWRLIVRARLSRAQDGRHEVAVKTPDGVPTENTCFGWEKWEKRWETFREKCDILCKSTKQEPIVPGLELVICTAGIIILFSRKPRGTQ